MAVLFSMVVIAFRFCFTVWLLDQYLVARRFKLFIGINGQILKWFRCVAGAKGGWLCIIISMIAKIFYLNTTENPSLARYAKELAGIFGIRFVCIWVIFFCLFYL